MLAHWLADFWLVLCLFVVYVSYNLAGEPPSVTYAPKVSVNKVCMHMISTTPCVADRLPDQSACVFQHTYIASRQLAIIPWSGGAFGCNLHVGASCTCQFYKPCLIQECMKPGMLVSVDCSAAHLHCAVEVHFYVQASASANIDLQLASSVLSQ